VAEDSLLNCPAMECSFHIQPAAFLVGKLNLFRIPTLSMIHYHLGRALLGNKVNIVVLNLQFSNYLLLEYSLIESILQIR